MRFTCFRAFHCFLTPSFVLLGVSAKSRCSGKLSQPSSLSRQAKTVIFISKITMATKSPILHFASMRTYNILYCPKEREKLLSFGMSQPFLSIPEASGNQNCRLARRCILMYDIATECQITVQVNRFGHSVFVFRN